MCYKNNQRKSFLKIFQYLFICLIVSTLCSNVKSQEQINKQCQIRDDLSESLLDVSEQNRNVKMIYAVFRHGARGPAKWSWISECINSFKKEEIGELTDFGKNQSFVNGLNTKACYPNFLKDFDFKKDLKAISRPINRTKESATNFMKGLQSDFADIKMDKMKNLYPFMTVNDHDDTHLQNEYSKWSKDKGLLKNSQQDLPELSDADLLLLGDNKELKAMYDSNCKPLKDTKKKKKYDPTVLASATLANLFKAAENDPKLYECFGEHNKNFDTINFGVIQRVVDQCTTQNFSLRGEKDYNCPEEFMKWVPSFHDYKHYGMYDTQQYKILGKNVATSILKELNDMKTNSEHPKLIQNAQSDTRIAPFYNSFLNIIPSNEDYVYNMSVDPKDKLDVPTMPRFADLFIMEVYEKSGEHYVRASRNWKRLNICKKNTINPDKQDFTDCTREEFIELLQKNMVSDEEVAAYCNLDLKNNESVVDL